MIKTNRKQGMKKKIAVVTGVAVLSTQLLGVSNVLAAPILDAPNASVPSSDETASAKYEFIAGFNKEKTKVEPFGGKFSEKANLEGRAKDWYTIKPTEDQKGKIGVRYTNVGRYGGEELDLVRTIYDWKSFNNHQGDIAFSKTHIGLITQQYDDVDQGMKFVKTGTDEEVKVSGFMTINDMDYSQRLTFSPETVQHIDSIKVPVKDSKIEFDENGGAWKFYAPSNYASNDEDLDAMFTFLYSDASELRFKWGRDNSDLNENSRPDETLVSGDYFGYLAKKPLRTETLVPEKKVTDEDEKEVDENTIANLEEGFYYDIYHTVPDEWADFYYKSYSFTDTILPVLDITKIEVFNEEGEDVSNFFTDQTEGNTVRLEATKEALESPEFYRHTYNYKIHVKLKPNADLSDYIDKEGSTNLPNQANVTIDDDPKDSNEVITHPPKVEQTAVKKIIDANGKLVDYADLKAGEAFQYRLDFNVPNTFKLDDLQLQDDLEDVLDLQGVHVLDANGDQDITEQGTLVLDEKKEAFTWTAKQPNTLAGHPIYVVVDAQVKDDADLTPYLNEENQVRIPNVGHMVINGKDLPTNEVNVSVPYKKEEKPVVKEKEMPQPKEAEKPLTVTTLPKTGTTGSGYGLLDFFTKWF